MYDIQMDVRLACADGEFQMYLHQKIPLSTASELYICVLPISSIFSTLILGKSRLLVFSDTQTVLGSGYPLRHPSPPSPNIVSFFSLPKQPKAK